MTVEEYREWLLMQNREDLEAYCVHVAKQRDAIQERCGYWMRRCELAEKQIYENLREKDECSKNPT